MGDFREVTTEVSSSPPPPSPSPPGRKTLWFLSSRLLWAGRGRSWMTKPGLQEQGGPVWCLNTPEAALGEIFLVGGCLLEVNSTVGFGWMLMRPRLYKGQLVSFCSLCYKPPPVSGQDSPSAGRGVRKQAGGFSQTDGSPAVFADG